MTFIIFTNTSEKGKESMATLVLIFTFIIGIIAGFVISKAINEVAARGELIVDSKHFKKPAFMFNITDDIRDLLNADIVIFKVKEGDLRKNFEGMEDD